MADQQHETSRPEREERLRALETAKQCYAMSPAGAWWEDVLFHNGDYRTPQGRLEIMDACFDNLTKHAGLPKQQVETARNQARRSVGVK